MEIKDGKNHILEVKELIIEYTQLLNRDLSFQNLEEDEKNSIHTAYRDYGHGKRRLCPERSEGFIQD